MQDKTHKNNISLLQQTELESRIIFINDSIDKDSAQKVNKLLLLLDEISNDPIKVFINSPGGDINSGFFIFDCIKFIRSPVYTIGAGLVASAAALIYLSVDKEHRISLPHARYMLHQPISSTRGVVTDIEIHAKEVDDLKKIINKIIASATNNSIAKIEKDTDRDYWLNAEDAKKYGMVHTIIQNKNDIGTLFPKVTEEKKAKNTPKKKKTTNTTRSTSKST